MARAQVALALALRRGEMQHGIRQPADAAQCGRVVEVAGDGGHALAASPLPRTVAARQGINAIARGQQRGGTRADVAITNNQ